MKYHLGFKVYSPATGNYFEQSKDVEARSVRNARRVAKKIIDDMNKTKANQYGTFEVQKNSIRFSKVLKW